MDMVNALDKFYANIQDPAADNLMFDYDGLNYMISYRGRYVITEDLETHDEQEYCLPGEGEEFVEAVLNAKVDRNCDKSIREMLAELPPEKLLV